jgi:glycosyltransferase involved in cell wall biosynthesis
MAITVVIITKNEAMNIVDCILSARKISNSIVVVDSGSTDATVLLARREHVQVACINWKGYGNARNIGAEIADHDWILSLDADERITDELAGDINRLFLSEENVVYGFYRDNYFENRKIRFGEQANDRVFRLYHRRHHRWNLVPVHERLVGEASKHVTLKSKLVHFGIRNTDHYAEKKLEYAALCALKYFQEKKKLAPVFQFISPVFNFAKGYIFQLGFLDLRIGFTVARINAWYTRKKYTKLHALVKAENEPLVEYGFIRGSLRKIISFLS